MKGKYVLVTTLHRGVFFGKLVSESKESAVLKEVRCAIKFGTRGGFLELANKGPNHNSRIGDQVEQIKLYDITSVTLVTETALEAWKKH